MDIIRAGVESILSFTVIITIFFLLYLYSINTIGLPDYDGCEWRQDILIGVDYDGGVEKRV